jgi:hypothetical protein
VTGDGRGIYSVRDGALCGTPSTCAIDGRIGQQAHRTLLQHRRLWPWQQECLLSGLPTQLVPVKALVTSLRVCCDSTHELVVA